MEWQDALNVLESVKSRYQAFDKLEDVARLIAGHEQHIRELEETLAGLNRQIGPRRQTVAGLEKRQVEMEEAIRVREEAYSKRQAEWEREIKTLADRYEVLVNESESRHQELVKKLEHEYEEHRAVLVRETGVLEARKVQLEQQIEEIKGRVGGL